LICISCGQKADFCGDDRRSMKNGTVEAERTDPAVHYDGDGNSLRLCERSEAGTPDCFASCLATPRKDGGRVIDICLFSGAGGTVCTWPHRFTISSNAASSVLSVRKS
jgi:hypothetical protein